MEKYIAAKAASNTQPLSANPAAPQVITDEPTSSEPVAPCPGYVRLSLVKPPLPTPEEHAMPSMRENKHSHLADAAICRWRRAG